MATHFKHGTLKEDRSKFVTHSVNGSILGSTTSVTDSATEIPSSALANRRTILIKNNGAQEIFLGPSGVTALTGYPLASGAEVGLEITDSVSIFGITASGSSDIRTLEGA